ncbi:hypothetical protein HY468_04905 [Candidatus Roizmanbacteria bacterium]|nr:hypothetical protein [Candidatus Roizmanbacteria bacterium]
MHKIDTLRQWFSGGVKGITYPPEETSREEIIVGNKQLLQHWSEYRPPDKWKYHSTEDLTNVLQDAGFDTEILSQQRIRGVTEQEVKKFRQRYAIPDKLEIGGEAYPYDGTKNSWLHVMDWAIAHDVISQEKMPCVIPEDADGLAAVYLIPDTGWEKGRTFWNREVGKSIARPSSLHGYLTHSFYSTFEVCSGAIVITGKTTGAINTFDSRDYGNYLHLFLLSHD